MECLNTVKSSTCDACHWCLHCLTTDRELVSTGVPAEKFEELFEAPQAALTTLEAEGAELVGCAIESLLQILREEGRV
ncbi:hypothetical protein E2C01_024370 [Portunus trituberculatus]|uniref:Uncharacterized protein n=1 Tax=Portunus trituberculatus TaxID=210409 RepID=A0A5B7EDM8_PORTR|nr:hypothetical protein [Portunus trituberculatus]